MGRLDASPKVYTYDVAPDEETGGWVGYCAETGWAAMARTESDLDEKMRWLCRLQLGDTAIMRRSATPPQEPR